MRNKNIILCTLVLFVSAVVAQAATLTISDTRAKPGSIPAGGTLLISCQVTHVDGPDYIERVAATMTNGNMNWAYPTLYDDGTNGDAVAEDGIYSLEITAGNTPGESQIVFVAVDVERNEIESEPVTLTIE